MANHRQPKRARRDTLPPADTDSDGDGDSDSTLHPILPYNVIDHIVSFLPFMVATQVCKLSSAFKHAVNFSRSLFFGRDVAVRLTRDNLVKILNRAFDSHLGKEIFTFTLHIDPIEVETSIDKWLRHCANKEIHHLDLYFLRFGYTLNASTVAGFTHLRTLKLVHCTLELPPQNNFHSMSPLQHLILSHVPVTSDMLRLLLDNCRRLQRIHLLHCGGFSRVEINAREHRAFREFRLAACKHLEVLVIDSPTIRSLYYSGPVPRIRIVEAFQLTEAYLNLKPARNRRYLSASELERLAVDIPNVTVLTTSAVIPEALTTRFRGGVFDEARYGFLNLKELQLMMEGGLFCNPYDIVMLMTRCPLLERLFIDMEDYNFECGAYWELHQMPKLEKLDCYFDRLKFIRLKGFKFLQSELNLVNILLKKAINLEALVFVTPKNPHTRLYRAYVPHYSQLFLSWKASQDAKIVLFGHTNDKSRVRPIHSKSWYR
ncbi:hypothetical protein Fmac_009895 [Flemingia macrophylla]|uniref:At1g61320/AtMIF1 LRR domain-containing protein n=1 Tax=Flemingia macrophylla TaxID=520843 RepID=A0ABD1N1I1_9FABA